MANTTAVYARIDTKLKDNAESILSQLGISPSSAIQMLYSQIVLKRHRCRRYEGHAVVEIRGAIRDFSDRKSGG